MSQALHPALPDPTLNSFADVFTDSVLQADWTVSRALNEVDLRSSNKSVAMSNNAPKSGAETGGDVTRILDRAQTGDSNAAAELLPVVYDHLRQVAAAKMAYERPDQTLQPTALVHEAWLRVVGNENQEWKGRAHFFGAAGEAMRRILVDRARQKKALKRGGNLERMDIDSLELPSPMPDDELLALDEALERLATVDTRAAEMVKLCFFVGLTQEEAARELGVSLSTAERIWGFARAWLLREVRKETT
jgi:RNA polymerase sigma factor (TIGR02999 family)